MNPQLARQLASKHADIVSRWKELLYLDQAPTPLGDADIMNRLIEPAVEEILRALDQEEDGPTDPVDACACGKNPFQPFYLAGRQAMIEALIQIQSRERDGTSRERLAALKSLDHAITAIVGRDVSAITSLCQANARQKGSQTPSKARNR